MVAIRYILAVVIRSVFMAIGIPGNALIIIVYAKKKRRTGTDVFILGLAIVDLIVCLSFPMKSYSYVATNFTNGIVCKFMFFMVYWNTYIGMFLTTMITIDRYIAVCRPLQRRVSPKQAAVIVVLISIAGAVCALPPVWITGIMTYGQVSRCTYLRSTKSVAISKVVSYLNDALLYLCIVIVTILYVLIFLAVRRQAKVMAMKFGGVNSVSGDIAPSQRSVGLSEAVPPTSDDVNDPSIYSGKDRPTSDRVNDSKPETVTTLAGAPGSSSCDSQGERTDCRLPVGSSNAPPAQNSTATSTFNMTLQVPAAKAAPRPQKKTNTGAPRARTHNKTTIMIFISTVIFFISWLPSQVGKYYTQVYQLVRTNPAAYTTFYVFLFAVNLNQVVNPFIYSFVNVQFRRECKTVFRQIRQCR